MRFIKRAYILLLIFLLGTVFSSCLKKNNKTNMLISFPIGVKAKKKNIKPPIEFVDAMFKFKEEMGHWPISEREFEVYAMSNKKIFNNFYNSGFTSWYLGKRSLDSLDVHFVHEPVYTQTIGTMTFDGKEVKLSTLFIASLGVSQTSLKKK